MLVTSAFVVFMIFALLREHPLGILLAVALTFFPGLVFLYLSCVRAGLVAIKASGPPDIKKLGVATIRLFRFNIMLNNVTMTILGLGGSVLFMILFTPSVWADLKAGFDLSDITNLPEMLSKLSQMPLGILLMLTFGLSVSNGIIGTSTAAVAANAADQGPNHHALWGITRQFFPLFVLSMLVLWLPTLAIVLYLGGPLEPLSSLAGLNIIFVLSLPLILVWAGCTICGGKALAYAQTREDMADEWVKERDDMLGEIVPEDNLRELRMKRQEASRLKDGDDVPDDLDDEISGGEEEYSDDEPSDPVEVETPEDLPEPEPEPDITEPPEAPEPVEEIVSDDTAPDDGQSEEDFRRLVEEKIAADAQAKKKAAAAAKRKATNAAKKKAAAKTKSRTKTTPKPKTKRKRTTKPKS